MLLKVIDFPPQQKGFAAFSIAFSHEKH